MVVRRVLLVSVRCVDPDTTVSGGIYLIQINANNTSHSVTDVVRKSDVIHLQYSGCCSGIVEIVVDDDDDDDDDDANPLLLLLLLLLVV